jgi:hypothetical protein
MIVEIKDENAKVFDPLRESPQEKIIKISRSEGYDARWHTPGSFLFNKIGIDPSIRFIGEKNLADYLQIIVVLDDDPEELVDRIFSIEQKMFKRFKNFRFDIRLQVISKEENIEAIKKNTIVHYDRDILKFIS